MVVMVDKQKPHQIFFLDDQSNKSTPGNERIKATWQLINVIHESSIIAHEVIFQV